LARCKWADWCRLMGSLQYVVENPFIFNFCQ
jgi:hypothetical protein